jgi:hypothetical protein
MRKERMQAQVAHSTQLLHKNQVPYISLFLGEPVSSTAGESDVKIKYYIDAVGGEPFTYSQCCESGMLIPDPGSEFFHPGSRVKKIQNPGSGSASKNLKYFNPKIVSKLSQLCSGMFIPDRIRILIFYPSRIPAPGVKKAPDTGSEFATLHTVHGPSETNLFSTVCLPAGWPSLLFGSLLLRRSSSKTVRSIVSPEAAFTESAILNHKAFLYLMLLF